MYVLNYLAMTYIWIHTLYATMPSSKHFINNVCSDDIDIGFTESLGQDDSLGWSDTNF